MGGLFSIADAAVGMEGETAAAPLDGVAEEAGEPDGDAGHVAEWHQRQPEDDVAVLPVVAVLTL